MARQDDYRVNASGTNPGYGITLNDLGLSFFGPSPVRGKFGPSKTTAPGGAGETPLIFNTYVNGMGMAYSGVPNTYAFSRNMYMRGAGKAMPSGLLTEISLDGLGFSAPELAGEIRCAMDWLGDVYIGAGQHIIRLVSGLTTPDDRYHTGANSQIDSCLLYNGIPVFSTDPTFAVWQYLTAYNGSAWVTANSNGLGTAPINSGAANYQYYLNPVFLEKMVKPFQEVDGVGGNRIIGNDTSFTYVQTQTNVINTLIGDTTAWSASLACGDSSYGITGIYGTNHIFFITKADGVYGIESSGIYCPNYVPDMAGDINIDNGIVGRYIFGKLFVGTPQGVLMVDVNSQTSQDVPTYVNPSFYLTNETPIFGLPTAFTSDNGWLVVAFWNGENSYLCYTRPRETTLATIPNPMVWHGSECTIDGQQITMLHKTSVSGSPQILIGTHDGTRMHLYTLSVPANGDPYVDYLHGSSNHQFARAGKLYLPFQDAQDSNAKKVVRRFETQTDGVSLPVTDGVTGDVIGQTQAAEIDFYANADSGSRVFFETVEPSDTTSEWSQQGVVSDSPRSTMIPSSDATAGSQIGILLDWVLENQGDIGSPIYSPFSIRSIKIRTDVYVEQLEAKTYVVALGNLQRTQTGARDQGDVLTKFLSLSALQNADAVSLIDEWHQQVLVKVEPGMSYEWRQEQTGQPPTMVVTFDVTTIGKQFIWDIGDPYDSVYAWGS